MAESTRQAEEREEAKIKELVNHAKERKHEIKAKLEMKNTEELTKLRNELDDVYKTKEEKVEQKQAEVDDLHKDFENKSRKVKGKRKALDNKRDELKKFRARVENFKSEMNALDTAVYDKESDVVQREKELIIREQVVIGQEESDLKSEDEIQVQHQKLREAEKKLGELSSQVSNKRKSYSKIREKIMNLEKRNQKLKQDLNVRELKLSNKENLMHARNKVLTMAKDLFSTNINDLPPLDDAVPRVDVTNGNALSESEPELLEEFEPDPDSITGGSIENLVDADLELELPFPLEGTTGGKKKKAQKKVVAKPNEIEDEIAQEPTKGARKKGGKKKTMVHKADEIILDSKLDPSITFDNYKVSDHNRIVYSIAQDIGNEPNNEFKMLYIYGSLGLGKTHLLHAIGNNIQTNDSDQNVMYIPAQEFFTNMTIALNNNKEKEFEKFFDSVKILLLDDFQTIPATKASHNMFKTILDNFLKNNKQMVLTGDRPIENIETLDKNFAKNLLIRSGMTIINLTESGIEILESLSKVRTH